MASNTSQTSPKVKKERSRAYPSNNLEDAIMCIKTAKAKLGNGPYGRVHLSESLGYKSFNGAAAQRIASIVHFKLFEAKKGGVYLLTDLGKKIINPIDDMEERNCIVEAAKQPTLYKEIMQKFNNQALPPKLEVHLARDFGILEKASKVASLRFKETMEFAKLLVNGVITDSPYGVPIETTNDDAGEQENEITKDEDVTLTSNPLSPPKSLRDLTKSTSKDGIYMEVMVPLARNRVATIFLPEPLCGDEFDKIKRWLDFHYEIYEMKKPENSMN